MSSGARLATDLLHQLADAIDHWMHGVPHVVHDDVLPMQFNNAAELEDLMRPALARLLAIFAVHGMGRLPHEIDEMLEIVREEADSIDQHMRDQQQRRGDAGVSLHHGYLLSGRDTEIEDAVAQIRRIASGLLVAASEEAAPAGDGRDTPAPFTPTEADWAILLALAKAPSTIGQVEIAVLSGYSRTKVSDRVPELEAAKLIHRPHGKRRGYTLTPAGHNLCASRAQSGH